MKFFAVTLLELNLFCIPHGYSNSFLLKILKQKFRKQTISPINFGFLLDKVVVTLSTAFASTTAVTPNDDDDDDDNDNERHDNNEDQDDDADLDDCGSSDS